MAREQKHLLVIAAGSVGKRHLGNLHSLGVERLSVVEPRPDRLDEARAIAPLEGEFRDLDMALRQVRYDGAVIASPPKYHVEQALALIEHGVPFFMEKPVCKSLDEALRLAQALEDKPVAHLLGYTFRWWPPLAMFREALSTIGTLRHATFVMGAHLADWHPWEPYQEFFMASSDLGGGALLDESHFLDLMLWFFGMPDSLFGEVAKISNLEIDTDDHVDCLASYASGMHVNLHLDLYTRPHQKYIAVTGDNGTIECRFEPNEVRIGRGAAAEYEVHAFACERNVMFVRAIEEFLQMLDGEAAPGCTLAEGIRVMRMIEALRESSREGRRIVPGEAGVR